jgi:hypothetical protein
MAASQPHYELQCEEEQWEGDHESYVYISEATEVEEPATPSADADTEPEDDDSGTESSCLCGSPEKPPQDHLKLRYSAGTADLNGHGAVHEQLPAGTDGYGAQWVWCCAACAWSSQTVQGLGTASKALLGPAGLLTAASALAALHIAQHALLSVASTGLS